MVLSDAGPDVLIKQTSPCLTVLGRYSTRRRLSAYEILPAITRKTKNSMRSRKDVIRFFVSWLCKGENRALCDLCAKEALGGLVIFYQMPDSFLQTIQGEFKHGEDHADGLDGANIGPFTVKPGIEPGGVAESLSQ